MTEQLSKHLDPKGEQLGDEYDQPPTSRIDQMYGAKSIKSYPKTLYQAGGIHSMFHAESKERINYSVKRATDPGEMEDLLSKGWFHTIDEALAAKAKAKK